MKMNVFISYRQTGVDKEIYKKDINFIKNIVEKNGHHISIFFEEDNPDPKDLNIRFLEKLKKVDLVLAYVNYKERSEGQLLELGMAYALGKKIKILVNKNIKNDYFLIYGLGELIEYSKMTDLDKNILT